MARTLVVSQPMFLPWVGLFEQIRLADVFVHYDDVQSPQGRSFMSRVQLKTGSGVTWLTLPIDHTKSGKLLSEVVLLDSRKWRSKHLQTIHHAYARSPYFNLMLRHAEEIYERQTDHLTEFNIAAIEQIARWLHLSPRFIRSSAMGVEGARTERLVALCEALDCDVYVTGHGALKYLDHQQFEDKKISVQYMDYARVPYEQGRGAFTPYVSILDAIANCGERTRDLLCSDTIYWRDFNVG